MNGKQLSFRDSLYLVNKRSNEANPLSLVDLSKMAICSSSSHWSLSNAFWYPRFVVFQKFADTRTFFPLLSQLHSNWRLSFRRNWPLGRVFLGNTWDRKHNKCFSNRGRDDCQLIMNDDCHFHVLHFPKKRRKTMECSAMKMLIQTGSLRVKTKRNRGQGWTLLISPFVYFFIYLTWARCDN